MNKRLMSPFAHLGRRAAGPTAAETDEDKKSKSKAEGDDETKEDEDDDRKRDDEKSKSKAEGDDDKKNDEDEDGEKSKASDDDDESDDQDTSARSARARERRRIRAIMVSASGRADPVAAAHLALDTSMPRGQAIGLLNAMQAGRDASPVGGSAGALAAREGLRSRMETVPNPSVGADVGGGNGGAPSLADRIVAAGKKRRGEI